MTPARSDGLTRRAALQLAAALAGAMPGRATAARLEGSLVRPDYVVYSRTLFNLPALVALDRGYFRQEGIDLHIVPDRSVRDAEAGLRAGTAPIALLGPEVVFLDGLQGGSLRIVAGNAGRLPHYIIARPHIHTLADLKGATFGVISASEGTTYLIPLIAAAAGIGRSDYKVVVAGSAPDRAAMLARGEIDVALQPIPLSYTAEANGFSNLGWCGAVAPDWQFAVYIVDRRWAEAHPELTRGYLRAVRRGRRFIARQPEAVVALATAALDTTPAFARRALAEAEQRDLIDADLRVSTKGLQAVYAGMIEGGSLPRGAPRTMPMLNNLHWP